MNLRGQILLGSLLLILLPLVLVVQVIRSGIEDRFTTLDTQRVTNQTQLVLADLDRRNADLAEGLRALAQSISADNQFRLAAVAGRHDLQSYVRDYAGRHMSLMDLDMLMILDPDGRVISSGHFRAAFDQLRDNLPRLLSETRDGSAMMTVNTPGGSFLALSRAQAIKLGGRNFQLIGGLRLDRDHLQELVADTDLSIAVVWPQGALATTDALAQHVTDQPDFSRLEQGLTQSGYIVRLTELTLIQADNLTEASLLVVHDRASLRRLLAEMNFKLAAVLVLAIALSVLLATIFAHTISRPLRDLAARTEDLDLERLDVKFRSGRRDEVGRLTRLLSDLTQRLREGVVRLRAAEHKATVGEVARQVNHDIRNGITPLRNVLGHLTQVAAQEPDQLDTIFRERQGTLTEGLAYLEDLAANYARLSGGRQPRPCHLPPVLEQVLAALPSANAKLEIVCQLAPDLPPVEADPVALRRILENLVRNARESLPDETGRITVSAQVAVDENLGENRLQVSVNDTGVGIPAENLDNIFNDFFTTKPDGTGLGLSNVRRLVGDCGGNIKVTSRPDHGTTFIVSFPVLEPKSETP